MILDLSAHYAIVLSAVVAIIYTLLGGFYSVAYTDVIQLFFMFISLWLCVPFLLLNPVSTDATHTASLNHSQQVPWLGELKPVEAGKWVDELLLMVRPPMQFVSIKEAFTSYHWNQTLYGLPSPFERGEAGKVLPITLHYLTPPWVSVPGIAGLAAAVMSSMDSVLLSSASIDLIYCVIFPQLICVLHCPIANGYGATAGYVLALVLRLLSGEPLLHLAPVLLFPGWRRDPETGAVSQYFPFRTLIMLLSMLAVPSASLLSRLAFTHRLLPASWDVLGVLKQQQHQQQEGEEGEEGTGEEDGEDEEGEKLVTVKEKLLAISSTSSQKVAGGEAASC
ncbi:hypothetical protein CRUP_037948 [Coryphaenoides rupestris]|nr:hypothetical protein CRUP_037948 [Coryphaenoides rupestris]